MNKYFLITGFLIILPIITISFGYNKNKFLLQSPKSPDSKVQLLNNYDDLRNIIFEKKENSILVFYADWCPHW